MDSFLNVNNPPPPFTVTQKPLGNTIINTPNFVKTSGVLPGQIPQLPGSVIPQSINIKKFLDSIPNPLQFIIKG